MDPAQGYNAYGQYQKQEEEPMEFHVMPARTKLTVWEKLGGGGLMVSLAVHGVFALIAIFLITLTVLNNSKKEEPEDFLVGGGGGGKSNNQKVATQRRSVSMSQPKTRIAANVSTSAIVLPDSPQITTASPMSAISMAAGGMGGGEGGMSGKGKGGLRGNGMGPGTGPGNMAGFVAMFGKRLEAKKLGVVLDVSGSMHRFLPAVVKEANKVGMGAPIVMSYGCGASEVENRDLRASKAKFDESKGKDFDHFWRRLALGGKPDKDTAQVDMNSPMDEKLKPVYDVVNGRKATYYMEKLGTHAAWSGLVAQELRDVDAVYWFADFQDKVDSETLEDLLRELQRRRQKLYVHCSGANPKSLAEIIEKVVKPTGGEEIKVDIKPAGN